MSDFRDKVNRVLDKGMKTFGETVTFYPKSGGIYEVEAVFDATYEAIDPDTEQLVSANQPTLVVNLNTIDFEMKQGDEVQVRDTRYKVTDKREDGQGGALLILHKVNATVKTEDTRANSRYSY
jgi:hypothetical protein